MREERLQQRRPAGLALGPQLLHQQVRGRFLMRQGGGGALAGQVQQLGHGLRAVEPQPQGQDVGEKADETVQFPPWPASADQTQDQIRPSAPGVEQPGQGRQQRAVERTAAVARQGVQSGHAVRLQAQTQLGGALVVSLGPREVRGQVQGLRRVRQFCAPPSQILGQQSGAFARRPSRPRSRGSSREAPAGPAFFPETSAV